MIPLQEAQIGPRFIKTGKTYMSQDLGFKMENSASGTQWRD